MTLDAIALERAAPVSGSASRSRLQSAAARAALIAAALSANAVQACPGTPAAPPDFGPTSAAPGDAAADPTGEMGVAEPMGPPIPQPCAPPPWIMGGPAPPPSSAYGAPVEMRDLDSAAPSRIITTPGASPTSPGVSYAPSAYTPSANPDAAAKSYIVTTPANPGVVTPPPVATNQGAANLGETNSITPPPQTYAALIPPTATLPPAPAPDAYRIAIAPKIPAWLAPLSPADVERYGRAYSATEKGLHASADAVLAQVEDPVLMGAILARRYDTRSTYKPRYAELYAWLVSYSDLPQADSIYTRAATQSDPNIGLPPRPETAKPRAFATAGLPPQPNAVRPKVPASEARIRSASDYFYNGQAEQALSTASMEFGQPLDGDARYIAGLAAFRLYRYAEAAQYFEIAARAPFYSQAEIAAAAFWAGRAHLAAGESQQAIKAFALAAAQPRSFYGQLAERQLGRDPSYRPQPVPIMNPEAAEDLFNRYPAARRAAALAQLGHLIDAEAEIRQLQRKVDPSEDVRLLSLAQALGLASAATRLAEMGGEELAAGLYPDPPYAPSDGFRLEKSLLFAIARQESRMNPEAVSSSNARGLMQLLPSTAAWIGENPQFRASPDLLFNPAINMQLGQRYVEHLIDIMSPDMVRVIAAYNMGPGAVKRWLTSVGDFEDSLLLIESIPKEETRTYVKRVLANVWLYEARFGQPSPSLEALASGKPAYYAKFASAGS